MLATEVFIAALASGLVLQPFLIPWLRGRQILDIPNVRSSHRRATPRGGGIAVGASLCVGLLVGRQGGWDVAAVAALGGTVGLLGLIDDVRDLSAKIRLGLLFVVGLVAGLVLDNPIAPAMGVAVMAVWTASYVNAFNFMDGINGISAISGLVAGVAYMLMGVEFDAPELITIGAALAGACVAFIPFNIPQARVFLGDVGSYWLGFVIASSAWLAWAAGVPLLLAVAPTTGYLADTGVTLVRRARAGEPLMQAHRSHTYQRLVLLGWPHVITALFVGAVAGGVTASVWFGLETGLPILGVVLGGAILAGYVGAPQRLRARR